MKHNQEIALPGLLHDLNNIFQTLVDAADRLSEDPRWAPLSAAILRSVERGRRVSFSLQAGHSLAAPFETILENAIAFVEDSRLAGRGPAIEFVCDVESGIALPGNWAWERVLINLFLNSMRAMPEGGTIQLQARRSVKQDQIQIVIRDTGCGIPAEVMGRLFEPHVSTKAAGGMGLHVVRTIVQQDGGTVCGANRADGPGAEFTITVPAPLAQRVASA
jgi:signal transduction histidine kinase